MAPFIQLVIMLGFRVIYRYIILNLRSRNSGKKGVIIGAGDAGNLLYKEISGNKKYNTEIIAFIDDDMLKINHYISGIPIVGRVNDLQKILAKFQVDIIYIAIPSLNKNRLKEIISSCKKFSVETKVMGISEIDNDRSYIRDISIDDLLGRGEVKLDNKEIANYLQDQAVMVTGAGGSIGSELCR